MADLTTLAKVHTYLGLKPTETDDDVLLGDLIAGASAWFRSQVDREISLGTYTETTSGNGGTTLVPDHYPIASVTSLTIGGDTIPARASVTDSGFVFDDISVHLDGYTFTKGVQNVVLVYSAGFATIPADLERAVIELVAWRYRERSRTGQVSAGVGGETVTFSTWAAPQSVNLVIAAYRRQAV